MTKYSELRAIGLTEKAVSCVAAAISKTSDVLGAEPKIYADPIPNSTGQPSGSVLLTIVATDGGDVEIERPTVSYGAPPGHSLSNAEIDQRFEKIAKSFGPCRTYIP